MTSEDAGVRPMDTPDDSAPTSAGQGPTADTTLIPPPPTTAAPDLAWSDEADVGTDPRPWGEAWRHAAVLVLGGVLVATFALAVFLLAGKQRDNQRKSFPAIVTTAATPPTTPGTPLATSGPSATSPETDDRGWTAYPAARCDSGNQLAVMARTAQSAVVVCEIRPENFYYRGVRLSDGASIELRNVVPSAQGFDITNPANGTVYRIRPTSLTITSPDGAVSSELMLQYLSRMPAATVYPTAPPAAALPPAPSTPTAKSPDDDEFVAMALSPQALAAGSQHNAGWGAAGTQARANQIALNECAGVSGNPDCLLINAGMFHGCVAFAVDATDPLRWSSGSGADPQTALTAATRRLDNPGFSAVQCSDPPGIIRR